MSDYEFKEASQQALLEGYDVDCITFKKNLGDIVCEDLAYKEDFIEALRVLTCNPTAETAKALAEMVNGQITKTVDDLAIWMEKGQWVILNRIMKMSATIAVNRQP